MAYEYKALRNPDIYGLMNQLNQMAPEGWDAISVMQAAVPAVETGPETAERTARPVFIAVVRKTV